MVRRKGPQDPTMDLSMNLVEDPIISIERMEATIVGDIGKIKVAPIITLLLDHHMVSNPLPLQVAHHLEFIQEVNPTMPQYMTPR